MEPALISLDVTLKTPADREKLARALQALAAEDGNLEVRAGVEPDCTVIGATSEAHLEEIVDGLKREFEVEARVGRPTVAYLETLTRSAEGSAQHVKMAHGQGEYAHVSLRLHPAETGTGYSFEDATIGGAIPKRFMTSIDSGIRESMANGVLRGYPIVGVRVEVHDGSYHDTDSTDAAFRTAAAMAFQEAAKKAQPLVLEPVMQVVVKADDRHVEAVLEGFLTRRGRFKRGRTKLTTRRSSPCMCRSRSCSGSKDSSEQRRTDTRPPLSGSPITNQWCMAPPVTMSPLLVLVRHVGQRQIFAPMRRPFPNQTTPIPVPEHRAAILLEPDGDQLKITLKGDVAGMLNAARDSKRSPDTGDLLVQIKSVAGACNPLNLEFACAAA